jgi:hypothetical protein
MVDIRYASLDSVQYNIRMRSFVICTGCLFLLGDRTAWSAGNVLDLYSDDFRFESLPGRRLS